MQRVACCGTSAHLSSSDYMHYHEKKRQFIITMVLSLIIVLGILAVAIARIISTYGKLNEAESAIYGSILSLTIGFWIKSPTFPRREERTHAVNLRAIASEEDTTSV